MESDGLESKTHPFQDFRTLLHSTITE